MRVVFQGAGAISIAAAALFTANHEVAVVSRHPRVPAAYPIRLPTIGAERTRRRVTISDWVSVVGFDWDLVVLSTRPDDLDESVREQITELAPPVVAITSQVDGDLERARILFPRSEILVFGPAILASRVEGTEVSYWSPLGAPVFLVASPDHLGTSGRAVVRELGASVLRVPVEALLWPPAVFIPYVAELTIRGGRWNELLAHLERPSLGAAEAVRAVTGMPVPMFPGVARAVLGVLDLVTPVNLGEYAGRHFSRHRGQTEDMLAGWAKRLGERRDAAGMGDVSSATGESAVLDSMLAELWS